MDLLKQKIPYNTVVSFVKGVYLSLEENRCFLRAGALTYVTTLSIVPFLAIAFSISKGLGFHHTEFIHAFLLKITANREDVVNNILTYINNTNVGKLGTLGVVTLLAVVVSLLGTIEDTLNSIFQIEKNRSLREKITSYFSITLLSPILVIVLITFSSSLANISVIKKILSYSIISHIYLFLLKVVPFFMVWFSIFLIFYYLPNGKVDTKSIAVGSLFASILWQVSRHIFVTYHPFNPKYNAIYGSFAKVLLILLWLFFSWVMLLIGAVIAQEFKSLKYGKYSHREKLGNFNIALKESIFLKIVIHMISAFKKGDGVVTLDEICNLLRLPPFIVKDFLDILKKIGFIVEVKEEGIDGFLIAFSIFNCSLEYFLKAIRNFNDTNISYDILDNKNYLPLDIYCNKKNILLSEIDHKLNIKGYLNIRKVNAHITSE